MPAIAHFGLGDATRVDRLAVRWPSGLVQQLADVPADQHIVVTEGQPGFKPVVPGKRIDP
jgi:hypothetical protein